MMLALEYPPKFSGKARAAVEAELIRAAHEHAKRKRKWNSEWAFPETKSIETYILSVFLTYARQAIELGKSGTWSVDEVRSQALEGLRRITILVANKMDRTYFLDGPYISSSTQRDFEDSSEWQQFETEFLTLAESVAAQDAPSWHQIRQDFLSGAEAYPDMCAHWAAKDKLWTLRNYKRGQVPAPVDLKAQRPFTETARAAVRQLGKPIDQEPAWHIWLDLMRSRKRGFYQIKEATRFRAFRDAAEGRIPDASGLRLLDDGMINNVFQASADFCEDLASGLIEEKLISATESPFSNLYRNTTADLPDSAVTDPGEPDEPSLARSRESKVTEAAMEYPEEFSPEAVALVEAERIKARQDLRGYRQRPETRPHREHTHGHHGVLWNNEEEDLHEYILRVFLAFAEQSCSLGLRGVWNVDRIRAESADFLRRFTVEAYYEQGNDREGHSLRRMTSNWSGGLLEEVRREFEKSDQWRQYEEKLLAVAEVQSRNKTGKIDPGGGSPELPPDGSKPNEENTPTWDAIEILFVSDLRVQISIGDRTYTMNFAEMGFADGRTQNPNRAWRALQVLAESDGVIGEPKRADKDWSRVEKRAQEIRQGLREHFKIHGDPLPFVSGIGYQALFKIRCSPSYHS